MELPLMSLLAVEVVGEATPPPGSGNAGQSSTSSVSYTHLTLPTSDLV